MIPTFFYRSPVLLRATVFFYVFCLTKNNHFYCPFTNKSFITQVLSKSVIVLTQAAAKKQKLNDVYSDEVNPETMEGLQELCRDVGGLHRLLLPNLDPKHFGHVLEQAPEV